MVTSSHEAHTKANKTKPGCGSSMSSMSTVSTAASALHSVPDASQMEKPMHHLDADGIGNVGKANPEFSTELPTVESNSESDFGQLEETSSGEFAFLEVSPEDFTVLHNVSAERLSWEPPPASTPEDISDEDTPCQHMNSCMKLWEPLQCEEKSDRSATSAPLQHASSFHEGFGTDSLPVRNTFIHIGCKEEVQREWSSCPGMIMAKEFHTKYPAMEQAHTKGDCRPCAYFLSKGDGCRWGGECRFCHLCPPGALKKKKKDKVKALKQRDYFLKIAAQRENVAT